MNGYVTIPEVQQEMHDIHAVHASCLFWRMRCLAHRLICFGWENSVKHLNAVEAICLASIVPPDMHDELVRAARLIADERWTAFIDRVAPRFAMTEEAITV